MRRPTLASALVILAAAPAFAQPVQSLARVKAGSASLYSGPGEAMPKCGSVEQGYGLVVDHAEGNDWLAVQPPVGSLSWISHLHVELQAPTDGRPVTFPANRIAHRPNHHVARQFRQRLGAVDGGARLFLPQ